MSKHVAFVRGINLGRRRRVSGADLRSLFDGMGFADAATFRTSGNVVFNGGGEPRGKMADRIERGLTESLGWDVTVFLRTAAEIRAIAARQPFPTALVEASHGKLQVVVLSAKPSARARKDVLALATDQDRLAFGDRELYWLPSAGTRDSALDLKAIEGLVGPTTMRTKGTVDQLVAKYFAG